MAATQMNIRMDAALKESGNAALARLGYTPSQAVRALWEVITVQGALPPALVRALNSNGDMPSRQEDPTEMESTSGAEIVSSFYRRLGIDEPSSTPWTTPSFERWRRTSSSPLGGSHELVRLH